jgi:hypothetical protein
MKSFAHFGGDIYSATKREIEREREREREVRAV